ncbi:PEF-CTERM sorting domain-containing protein [Methanolobus halotolerans]|uniref:PEF-CTERM sorting domain-containing protein n=1 Tax=Methanolobus halotolerans TaxID=2052935 RepID=UPI001F37D8A1|nr:PEF-CTERM sorting domain-containing protein [Methanolobus halotolerans]
MKMKRIVILTMVLLMAGMSLAAAADECTCGDGTPLKFEDDTDVDFEDVDVGDTFTLEIPDYPGKNVTIEITEVKDESQAIAFNWTSDIPVCSVLVFAAAQDETTYFDGATSGEGETPNSAAISHITFCFNDDGNGQQQEIPEFPTVALPIAAILGLAFMFQRRKE